MKEKTARELANERYRQNHKEYYNEYYRNYYKTHKKINYAKVYKTRLDKIREHINTFKDDIRGLDDIYLLKVLDGEFDDNVN